ncbi:CHASE2 domain-containing protein [Iodobacter arcticus]|uniref:CHASE2 domain-containing protein n=1 Tax=Iodobacter arcticus TaxID=590593 RepID=A0ABW2QYT1_9NEIS
MHKSIRIVLASCAVIGASCLGLHFCAGADELYRDVFHRLAGARAPASHVVLLTVDDATLAQYPDTPLAFFSPLFARAAQTAIDAGAKVIALDFMLGISAEQWLAEHESPKAGDFDQPIRALIGQESLLLPALKQADRLQLPATAYTIAVPDFDLAHHLGRVDLPADGDGIVRRIPLVWHDEAEGSPVLSMPLLLALRYSNQQAKAKNWHLGGQVIDRSSSPQRIAWLGPPGTVPQIAMHRLLAKQALQDPQVLALKGKALVLGGAYTGMQDWHLTPYGMGMGHALMSGPEILAQSAEMLLSGRRLMTSSIYWQYLSLLLIALSLLYGFILLNHKWLLPTGILILLLPIAVAYLAFLQDLLWPVFPVQIAIASAMLAAILLKLNRAARKQRYLTELFGRFVSPAIVKQMAESDTMPVMGGERVVATVLFCDIRSFTSLSELLKPEDVVELLNAWFERACAIAWQYGGTVDKLIGDAMMVEFGTPLRHLDHAHRAVAAGLALEAAAHEMSAWVDQRFPAHSFSDFAIGVGLHTGPLVIGNIGSSLKTDYTAIGDTVNVAARLEGLGKTLGCVVVASHETVQAVAGIVTGDATTLLVKGRAEPVVVYAVHGLGMASNKEQEHEMDSR